MSVTCETQFSWICKTKGCDSWIILRLHAPFSSSHLFCTQVYWNSQCTAVRIKKHHNTLMKTSPPRLPPPTSPNQHYNPLSSRWKDLLISAVKCIYNFKHMRDFCIQALFLRWQCHQIMHSPTPSMFQLFFACWQRRMHGHPVASGT